jgi:hypothetical protein
LSKVPQVTLVFWVIKILATTVGETGGDALSMTLNLGYAVSSLIFLGFFCVTLTVQLKVKRYHPLFYWPSSWPPRPLARRRPTIWIVLRAGATSGRRSSFSAG